MSTSSCTEKNSKSTFHLSSNTTYHGASKKRCLTLSALGAAVGHQEDAGIQQRIGECRRFQHQIPCVKKSMRQVQASKLTFSSMKFKQPSLGTKAAIFFPFLISCTRAHLRMAELGCFASIPLHSRHAKEAISRLALVPLYKCPRSH